MTIYAKKGSYAEDYANEHEFNFCAVETPTEPTTESTTEDTDGTTEGTECNHICHKKGIAAFFYKIARFFWKMFKINKTCDCGIDHY